MKVRWLGLVLAVVRDLREQRAPASPEEIADFETDVLAGFVLARASAGLAGATIRGDVGHLEQVRVWFGKSLWDMEPADADIYFGVHRRGHQPGVGALNESVNLTWPHCGGLIWPHWGWP